MTRRHSATRRTLEQQARDLDERRRALDAERIAWEQQSGVSLDDLRRRSLEANSKEYAIHYFFKNPYQYIVSFDGNAFFIFM